jgi:phosphoribosyl 1,2-cyclic phosphodiesterase
MEIKILASGSSGNAYRISDGKTTILLDAGIVLRSIQIGCQFKLSQIEGCFITHSHMDHSKVARELARLGVDVYTSQGTIDACGLTGHRIIG